MFLSCSSIESLPKLLHNNSITTDIIYEVIYMNGNKILAALSYFSVLFAPILFPIIVWIVGDAETKPHAKRALWTHIIPSIATFIGVTILGIMGLGSDQPDVTLGIGTMIVLCICGIISLYYFIWNIVKGIKVLKA